MNYIKIVNTVALIAFVIFTLLYLHFFFFAVVGFFKKKKYPKTDRKLRYGAIIPARNEEAVVGNLIDSIRRNRYPQDKLDVFVIAHNCTDQTARVAREHGAIVYEYNNPEECTMGYAFRYLFDRIREDYGIESYDGYFLFNADNVLDADFFARMNDAFVARGQKTVITSFRNSKNFGENLISACYGLYFMYGCRFESRGRTVLGCSTRVQGTGYVIPNAIVKNGWKYVTLTEDWDFTVDQILGGEKIEFCDEAVFYDEQPTSLGVMWRQRLRWSKGHLLVCMARLPDMLRALFTPRSKGGSRHKGSLLDIIANILPVCVISSAIFLLQMIALLFSPLFGCDLGAVLHGWFLGFVRSTAFSYGTLVAASVILYIGERKRIRNVSIPIRILSTLLWPAFLFVSVPAEIVSLFWKNMTWKTIPHTNTTGFSELNKESGDSASETE